MLAMYVDDIDNIDDSGNIDVSVPSCYKTGPFQGLPLVFFFFFFWQPLEVSFQGSNNLERA